MMKICVIALCGFAQLSNCDMSSSLRGTLREDFGDAVLKELEEALGSSEHREQTEQTLHEFEADLRTTFKALPKNRRGAVEGPYARYALHRLFVQRYGWQVKGLEMTSGAWYAGAGVGVMGDRVPPKMRELFEKRLGSHGLLLHELAVLAATLDAMFRNDVYDRLSVVYAALEYNKTDIVKNEAAWRIAHAYIAALILGKPVEELHTSDVILSDNAFMVQERSVQITDLLWSTMPKVAGADPENFDWEFMTSWFVAFGKQLGHVEDKECKFMKFKLLLHEAGVGTGRVRVSVIIPNYLQGATNCISPAGYYSICCFDECEALMDKIEAHFAAPAATPDAIATFISALPSASVLANRSLSPGLLEALNLMADRGMVALHSKHFAEWMHQAYPRECSHPQQSNTDRFNQTLRHFIEEIKAEHAKEIDFVVEPYGAPGSPETREGQTRSVAFEMFVTCVVGGVSMALAKLVLSAIRSSRGKSSKLL
eukprot:TRINITY_DN9997_c0_g1_i2.p1 TRINITY_DN9997_c0_g1~~TRINITY_DN9997_c0_g1_i2.p1  ORF type:complete len:483 (-),score=93.41 TRINITY_DN9997_c0_g1_i2:38-1486(-)